MLRHDGGGKERGGTNDSRVPHLDNLVAGDYRTTSIE